MEVVEYLAAASFEVASYLVAASFEVASYLVAASLVEEASCPAIASRVEVAYLAVHISVTACLVVFELVWLAITLMTDIARCPCLAIYIS